MQLPACRGGKRSLCRTTNDSAGVSGPSHEKSNLAGYNSRVHQSWAPPHGFQGHLACPSDTHPASLITHQANQLRHLLARKLYASQHKGHRVHGKQARGINDISSTIFIHETAINRARMLSSSSSKTNDLVQQTAEQVVDLPSCILQLSNRPYIHLDRTFGCVSSSWPLS